MASSVTTELLKQLSTTSESLNNLSNAFNDQIKAIEEALASYNLGVAAWAEASRFYEEIYKDARPWGVCERRIMVGYAKWQGKWCLMASSDIPDEDYPEGCEQWALRDAPREIRLKAIEGIPRLLEKLIAEATRLAGEVSKKTTEARVLASSIKPKKENQIADRKKLAAQVTAVLASKKGQ